MDTLKIERVGGFAGFGTSGSPLQSSGEVAISALSGKDRAAVEGLFDRSVRSQGTGPTRDGFSYRITREKDGKVVEVPEDAVPLALRSAVVDRLR